MNYRSLVSVGIFVFFFIVNPAYFTGCVGSSEPDGPDFGEAEMMQVLDSVNEAMTWQFDSAGTTYSVTLTLQQQDGEDIVAHATSPERVFATRAYACGNRTFLNSASACITTTSMPVVGELTLRASKSDGDVELLNGQAVTGELTVFGNVLQYVDLMLTFGDNGESISLSTRDAQTFAVTDVDAQGLGDGTVNIAYHSE